MVSYSTTNVAKMMGVRPEVLIDTLVKDGLIDKDERRHYYPHEALVCKGFAKRGELKWTIEGMNFLFRDYTFLCRDGVVVC